MGTIADKLQYLVDAKNLIKTAIQGKGQSFSGTETFRDYATKIGNISTECTAVASNILSGKTAYSGGSKITGTIASKGAQTYSPSTSTQTITAGQYLSGTQNISAVTGTAGVGDVLSGKTFASASGVGITGTMTNRGAVASTITVQGGQYTVPVGYHNGSGAITANFANLVAGNIKNGVNVGGVVGTLVSPATTNYVFEITASPYANYYDFSITLRKDISSVIVSGNSIKIPMLVSGSGYKLNSIKQYGSTVTPYVKTTYDYGVGYYVHGSSSIFSVDITVLT